jgi:uncharacterized protein YggE
MRIAKLLVLATFVVPAGTAFAQMPQSSQPTPAIATTGSGEARAVPDRATVYIGVQTRAATAAAAGADNARRVKAVLDTLRASGLTSAQLSTVNYSVSPEMAYPSGQSPRVTGYTVNNEIRAEVPSIGRVGGLIDAALAKGANQVSRLDMESSKADSARSAALADAVVAARADAEAMARAAGGHLGALLELSSNASSSAPRPMYAMVAGGTARAAPTPIEAGEQTITAMVSARWAFVPNP